MKKFTFLLTFLLVFAFTSWGQTYDENFDIDTDWAGGAMGSYNAKTYTNPGVPTNDQFSSNSAVRESSSVNSGSYAWRTATGAGNYLRYECEETVSGFQVYMARWDNSPKPFVDIKYSTNSGTSYSAIATIDGDYFDGDKVYKLYSYTFPTNISPDAGEKIYIEFETTIGERMLYDDFQLVYVASGNLPPTIFNIGKSPVFPKASDDVYVYADVTDSDGTLANVELHWGTAPGIYGNTIPMSVLSGDTYEVDTDIPAQSNNTTVYFEIEAEDNDGGVTTSPEESYILPATTDLPYSENFDADLGACYSFSVLGNSKAWEWDAAGTAYINGYDSGEIEEDWLILPAVDLDSYSNEVLTFDNWWKYGVDEDADNYFKLYYSTDYQGTGDPSSATWNELLFTKDAWDTWGSSGPVDLSGISGSQVYLAFKYRYDVSDWRSWQIDNIEIYEANYVEVTFQVNMAEETVSGDGVTVAGSFNGWTAPFTAMTNSTDDIYEVTLSLIEGIEYQFKYVNGIAWGADESVPAGCQAPGTSNRFEVIGDTDYTLDLVCFGSCADCGTLLNYDITFQVDMQNETVSGDGVYLAGSFTNWAANALPMTQSGNIWSTTVSLPETNYEEYKFVNGDPNSGGSWESISNRQLNVPSANTTLDLVCFNSYEACPPPALLISEVADPGDDVNARFIELYNASSSTIDFDVVDWYIVKNIQTGSRYSFKLTGSVDAGNTFVVAGSETNFNTAYGFIADQSNGQISGNGDDSYYLYIYGDHTSGGTLVDVYGILGEDGSGTAWDYEDTKAVRLRWVDSPSATWQFWEWHIPEAAGTLDMTPAAHKEDVSWVGTSGTEWTTKGDWSGSYGYIPDASFNVTIPVVANMPEINYQAACNDLTINTDAYLIVSVTIFDIYGNLNVNSGAGMYLFTSGSQIASVIVQGTATGNTAVTRYFTGYDEGSNGWHNIASPVSNMTIAGSHFEPGANDDLYQWDEPSNTWENYKQNHFTEFENGRGYLNAFELSGFKQFIGTLNTNDIAVTGLTKDDGGFHLLGNPFSSSLRWDDGNWNLTNIGAVAQIWDESNSNYAQIGQYGIIPSTNGFFVEVATAPGSLTIPKYARVHDIVDNYKKAATTVDLIETIDIKLTNDENTYYDLCRVGFKNDATEAWDMEYDAHKLFGGSGTSQLWSVLNNENFVYNFIPYVYESYQLPLYFRAGVNGTHHINVEGIESFYANSGIYLEDLKTGDLINLSEQQLYTFTASTEDDEARFILHFSGITTVGEKLVTDDVQIYTYGNSVYFRFKTMPENDAQVSVFNIIGQKVYTGEVGQSTLSSIRLNEKPGIYVVRLQSENVTTTQKVMIK